MSGIQRFLSKREKHGHGKHHSRNPRDKVHSSHSTPTLFLSRLLGPFPFYDKPQTMPRLSCCVSRTSSLSSSSTLGPVPILVEGEERGGSFVLRENDPTDLTTYQTTTTVHDSHSSSIPDKFHGFFSADSPAEPDEQPKVGWVALAIYNDWLMWLWQP